MFFRLAQADDVQIFATLRVGDVYNAAIQKTKRIDALLSVRFPNIFPTDHRAVENRIATDEVQPVAGNVALAFVFVVSDHLKL